MSTGISGALKKKKTGVSNVDYNAYKELRSEPAHMSAQEEDDIEAQIAALEAEALAAEDEQPADVEAAIDVAPETDQQPDADPTEGMPSEPVPAVPVAQSPAVVKSAATSGSSKPSGAAKPADKKASVMPTFKKRGLAVATLDASKTKAADPKAEPKVDATKDTASKPSVPAMKPKKKISVQMAPVDDADAAQADDEHDAAMEDQAAPPAEADAPVATAAAKPKAAPVKPRTITAQTKPATAAPKTASKPVMQKAATAPKPATDGDAGKEGKKANKKAKQDKNEGTVKKPKAKTAFLIFSMEKRAAIKAEDPTLSLGDVSKKLGELWKDLPEVDKKPYQDKHIAEKLELQKQELENPTPAVKPSKAAKKADDVEKPIRVKSSYMLFCDANREEIKQQNPEAAAPQIFQLLAAAWKAANEDEKGHFQKMHEELKTAAGVDGSSKKAKAVKTNVAKAPAPVAKKAASPVPAAVDEAEMDVDEGAGAAAQTPQVKKGKPTAARLTAKKPNQAKQTAARPKNAETVEPAKEEEEAVDAEPMQEDESDDSDREDVDWDEHPAEMIIGHTFDGKYLVKRKGLDLTQYGKVDSRAAKRQRFEDTSAEERQCPVDISMVEEYEEHCNKFWGAVREHSEDGGLDLDDLEPNSLLEACYFLGKLREDQNMMHTAAIKKVPRGHADIMIKVPLLGMSLVVQRLLGMERRKIQTLEEALQEKDAQLAEYEAAA